MKTQTHTSIRIMLLGLFLLSLGGNLRAENLNEVVNLKGYWKFSVGDNSDWSKPSFNDSDWSDVIVPRSWESNGYQDYNGYAWYRKSFNWNDEIKSGYIMLCLGQIDDADEVYVNGKLVGATGLMLPKPVTAFNVPRRYAVPVSLLNSDGENTVSVRVYDYYMDGGIVNGHHIGLYIDEEEELLEINLAGYWHFETEAEINKRKESKAKYKPSKIFVPGYWESQGYNTYDGKAVYKTKFTMPKHLANQELMLVLGFVDDVEIVYLNKEKIGSVIAYEKKNRTGLEYDQIFRGYKIPNEHLRVGAENLITVVIFDKGGLGGIYKGPIGITTVEKFEKLNELNVRYQSSFELFLNSFKR